MYQPRAKPPSYRLHKASGQAIVTLSGKDFYLGPHGTKVSKSEYDRVVGEWMANGRTLPRDDTGATGITVIELLNAFRKADAYPYGDSPLDFILEPTGASPTIIDGVETTCGWKINGDVYSGRKNLPPGSYPVSGNAPKALLFQLDGTITVSGATIS